MIAVLAWHALYVLGTVVMITALLIAGIVFDVPRCKEIFRPWDYLGAALLLGGDGKHSISAYCGVAMATGGPRALVLLGGVIDKAFGEGHCIGAAKREGLLA